MPDINFNCTACGQAIVCDPAWAGHQIQCPICQGNTLVPAPLPPQVPPSSQTRPSQMKGRGTQNPGARMPKQTAGKGRLGTLLKVSGVVIVLGVGGYFGFGWLSKMQDKTNEKGREAARNSDGGEMGHIANLYSVLDATDPDKRGSSGRHISSPSQSRIAGSKSLNMDGDDTDGTKASAPNMTQLPPAIAPAWTLDIAKAKIPEGRATGTIGGTNFLPDTARVERNGTAQVLALRQGTAPAVEREMLVYLHPSAGENVAGHKWSIDKDMTGSAVPRVLARWRPNTKAAFQQKPYTAGYAMKLEFGSATNGVIPGKIYAAFPDDQQSVVAGLFQVDLAVAEAAAQTSGAAAAAVPVQPVQPAASATPLDRRYGVKR